MTLGIDASTSTVGWAFSENSQILSAGFIDIKSCISSKDKTNFVISKLSSSPLLSTTTVIHLEAALSGFAGGFTSQQVIIKLARFNAVFEYIISEQLKLPVRLLNVNTARKSVFGKCRIKGVKSKEFVKLQLEKLHDIHKFDITNKKGTWDQRNSDMYDAMVQSLTLI